MVDAPRQAEHTQHLADSAGVLSKHRQLVDRAKDDGRRTSVNRVVCEQERQRMAPTMGAIPVAMVVEAKDSGASTILPVTLIPPQARRLAAYRAVGDLVVCLAGVDVAPAAVALLIIASRTVETAVVGVVGVTGKRDVRLEVAVVVGCVLATYPEAHFEWPSADGMPLADHLSPDHQLQ